MDQLQEMVRDINEVALQVASAETQEQCDQWWEIYDAMLDDALFHINWLNTKTPDKYTIIKSKELHMYADNTYHKHDVCYVDARFDKWP